MHSAFQTHGNFPVFICFNETCFSATQRVTPNSVFKYYRCSRHLLFFMVSYVSHIHTQEEKSHQVEIFNCSHVCHHLHNCYKDRHCSILLSDVSKMNGHSTPRPTLPLQPHLSVHLARQSPAKTGEFNAQDGQPYWALCSGGCLEEPYS